MATTPKKIHDAIVMLLRRTAPPTEVSQAGSPKYEPKSSVQPWSRSPASDIDRRFMVATGPGGGVKSYGNGSTHESQLSMTITIGHVIGASYDAAEVRRVADATKIVQEVTDRANYPEDVWVVTYQRDALRDLDGVYTLTELQFSITYEEANP